MMTQLPYYSLMQSDGQQHVSDHVNDEHDDVDNDADGGDGLHDEAGVDGGRVDPLQGTVGGGGAHAWRRDDDIDDRHLSLYVHQSLYSLH